MVFLFDTSSSDRHPDQEELRHKLNPHFGFIAHTTHFVTLC